MKNAWPISRPVERGTIQEWAWRKNPSYQDTTFSIFIEGMGGEGRRKASRTGRGDAWDQQKHPREIYRTSGGGIVSPGKGKIKDDARKKRERRDA